jgi:endonuclease/exonuclease/phosphatase family metal-dependent hydrolase
VLGDLNAKMYGPRCMCDKTNPRTKELERLKSEMQLCSLIVEDQCTGPKYTYCNLVGGPQTLIDHILVSEYCRDLVSGCAVIDEHPINMSDHLPVTVKIYVTPLCITNS